MFKTTYHPESIVIFYLHMRTAMMTTTMTINMEIVVLSTTFFTLLSRKIDILFHFNRHKMSIYI